MVITDIYQSEYFQKITFQTGIRSHNPCKSEKFKRFSKIYRLNDYEPVT